MSRLHVFMALVAFLFCRSPLPAQQVIKVFPDFKFGILGTEGYELHKTRLCGEEADVFKVTPEFKSIQNGQFNLGTDHCGLLFHFRLQALQNPGRIFLKCTNPNLREVTILIRRGTEDEIIQLGSDLTFHERGAANNGVLLSREDQDSLPADIFAYISPNQYLPMNGQWVLWQESVMTAISLSERIIMGSYVGFHLIFIFILFQAIFVTRQWHIGYYILFLLMGLMYVGIDNGYHELIWTDSAGWNTARFVMVIINAYTIFGLLFFHSRFKEIKRIPRMILVNKLLILGAILMGILYLFSPWFSGAFYRSLFKINLYWTILCGLYVMGALLYLNIKHRNPVMFYFMLGYGIHAIGILWVCLEQMGWIPKGLSNTWVAINTGFPFFLHTPHLFLVGTSVEIFVIFYVVIRQYKETLRENILFSDTLVAEQKRVSRELYESLEKERGRIATELHDSLGVQVNGIQMKLRAALEQRDVDKKNQYISESMDWLNKASKEARQISHDLMPAALQKLGVVAAIDDLVERFNQPNGHTKHPVVRFNRNFEQLDMPSFQALHIFRIIQELLHNAMKHADAHHIDLQMLISDGQLTITQEDDGKGFDGKRDYMGLGLKSIQNRVAQLNGRFDIESSSGHGSMFIVEVPV